MRYALLSLLIAVPIALLGWVAWRGQAAIPPELELTPVEAREEPSLVRLLSASLGPAKREGEVSLFGPKELFNYINGAAPLYLERNFRQLAAAELSLGDGAELTCDVYEMASPEDARSIFTAERSSAGKPLPDWAEALAGPMFLVFHEGRYYVKLTGFDERSEAALVEIARALRGRMK